MKIARKKNYFSSLVTRYQPWRWYRVNTALMTTDQSRRRNRTTRPVQHCSFYVNKQPLWSCILPGGWPLANKYPIIAARLRSSEVAFVFSESDSRGFVVAGISRSGAEIPRPSGSSVCRTARAWMTYHSTGQLTRHASHRVTATGVRERVTTMAGGGHTHIYSAHERASTGVSNAHARWADRVRPAAEPLHPVTSAHCYAVWSRRDLLLLFSLLLLLLLLPPRRLSLHLRQFLSLFSC